MDLILKLEDRLRDYYQYRYWPTWSLRLIDIGLHIRKSLKHYPLADQVDSLSCQPFFIISAGRSGTTLLRSMLVAGGNIAMPPETNAIPVAIRRYLTLRHLGWDDSCRLIIALFESTNHFPLWNTNLYPVYQKVINLPEKERSLSRIIDEIYVRYWQQNFPEARLWGDKTPTNTLNLPRIYRVFPQAKYLHLLRDSQDTISSMVARGRNVELATIRWLTSIERAVSLQNQIGEDLFLDIRYESLVTEPKDTLERICDFIGIDYSNKMLEFWRLPTTVEHRLYDYHANLGKPLFDHSIQVWKERLSTHQQTYVLSKTEKWLQYFGYKI